MGQNMSPIFKGKTLCLKLTICFLFIVVVTLFILIYTSTYLEESPAWKVETEIGVLPKIRIISDLQNTEPQIPAKYELLSTEDDRRIVSPNIATLPNSNVSSEPVHKSPNKSSKLSYAGNAASTRHTRVPTDANAAYDVDEPDEFQKSGSKHKTSSLFSYQSPISKRRKRDTSTQSQRSAAARNYFTKYGQRHGSSKNPLGTVKRKNHNRNENYVLINGPRNQNHTAHSRRHYHRNHSKAHHHHHHHHRKHKEHQDKNYEVTKSENLKHTSQSIQHNAANSGRPLHQSLGSQNQSQSLQRKQGKHEEHYIKHRKPTRKPEIYINLIAKEQTENGTKDPIGTVRKADGKDHFFLIHDPTNNVENGVEALIERDDNNRHYDKEEFHSGINNQTTPMEEVTTKKPTKAPIILKNEVTTEKTTKAPDILKIEVTTKKPTKAPVFFKNEVTTKKPTKTPIFLKNEVTTKKPTKAPDVTKKEVTTGKPNKAPDILRKEVTTKKPTKAPDILKKDVTTKAPTKAPDILKKDVTTKKPTKAPDILKKDVTTKKPTKAPSIQAEVDDVLCRNANKPKPAQEVIDEAMLKSGKVKSVSKKTSYFVVLDNVETAEKLEKLLTEEDTRNQTENCRNKKVEVNENKSESENEHKALNLFNDLYEKMLEGNLSESEINAYVGDNGVSKEVKISAASNELPDDKDSSETFNIQGRTFSQATTRKVHKMKTIQFGMDTEWQELESKKKLKQINVDKNHPSGSTWWEPWNALTDSFESSEYIDSSERVWVDLYSAVQRKYFSDKTRAFVNKMKGLVRPRGRSFLGDVGSPPNSTTENGAPLMAFSNNKRTLSNQNGGLAGDSEEIVATVDDGPKMLNWNPIITKSTEGKPHKSLNYANSSLDSEEAAWLSHSETSINYPFNKSVTDFFNIEKSDENELDSVENEEISFGMDQTGRVLDETEQTGRVLEKAGTEQSVKPIENSTYIPPKTSWKPKPTPTPSTSEELSSSEEDYLNPSTVDITDEDNFTHSSTIKDGENLFKGQTETKNGNGILKEWFGGTASNEADKKLKNEPVDHLEQLSNPANLKKVDSSNVKLSAERILAAEQDTNNTLDSDIFFETKKPNWHNEKDTENGKILEGHTKILKPVKNNTYIPPITSWKPKPTPAPSTSEELSSSNEDYLNPSVDVTDEDNSPYSSTKKNVDRIKVWSKGQPETKNVNGVLNEWFEGKANDAGKKLKDEPVNRLEQRNNPGNLTKVEGINVKVPLRRILAADQGNNKTLDSKIFFETKKPNWDNEKDAEEAKRLEGPTKGSTVRPILFDNSDLTNEESTKPVKNNTYIPPRTSWKPKPTPSLSTSEELSNEDDLNLPTVDVTGVTVDKKKDRSKGQNETKNGNGILKEWFEGKVSNVADKKLKDEPVNHLEQRSNPAHQTKVKVPLGRILAADQDTNRTLDNNGKYNKMFFETRKPNWNTQKPTEGLHAQSSTGRPSLFKNHVLMKEESAKPVMNNNYTLPMTSWKPKPIPRPSTSEELSNEEDINPPRVDVSPSIFMPKKNMVKEWASSGGTSNSDKKRPNNNPSNYDKLTQTQMNRVNSMVNRKSPTNMQHHQEPPRQGKVWSSFSNTKGLIEHNALHSKVQQHKEQPRRSKLWTSFTRHEEKTTTPPPKQRIKEWLG